MLVSFFTTVIVFEPKETKCRWAHRSAQPSGDGHHDERDVQLLNTRVGTTPACAAIHSTYGSGIAGITADPDYPCIGATATHGHDRPLFDNSTRSAINDIAGLTDGQLPCILPRRQTQVLSVTLLNR